MTKKIVFWALLAWFLCMASLVGWSARSAMPEEEGPAWAVPTFECLGLYCNSPEERGECRVQFRQADEPSWQKALPLVYDPRDRQYRGSLVGLKPDTEYLVRLDCGKQSVEFSRCTRSEQFPIGNPPLRFGREAAPAFAPAPWEKQ